MPVLSAFTRQSNPAHMFVTKTREVLWYLKVTVQILTFHGTFSANWTFFGRIYTTISASFMAAKPKNTVHSRNAEIQCITKGALCGGGM